MSDDANQRQPETEQSSVADAPQAAPQHKVDVPKTFDFNTKIQALWNGKVPLVEAFWLYFFAVVIVMSFLGNVLGPLSNVFAILGTIWAGFMIKPIWVAADNYGGPSHWALAAKVAAVGIGITVVGDLLAF